MKEKSFENSLSSLEKITGKLEEGNIPLDEALKLFEEGVKLSRYCEEQLNKARERIEILKNCDIPSEDEDIDQNRENKENEDIEDNDGGIVANDDIIPKTTKKKQKKNELIKEENLLF